MPRGSEPLDLKPPTRGAVASGAPHLLPPDAVPADVTKNVVMRDGWLVNRPGFAEIDADLVTGRPMGLIYYKEGTTKRTVVATLSSWYSYASGTYTDLSAALTGTADDHVRFTLWPTGTNLILLGVNGALNEAVTEWTGTGATALTAGSPPPADDITVSTNRVILARTFETGIEQYYRIRWSAFNDRASYPAANFTDLSDTPDLVVGARAITRTAFAIHKDESQWIGLGRSGSQPFQFQLQDTKPGPVSTAAIVSAEGRHWYLGIDGSFYMFDGTRCSHIGEGIRRYVVKNLNFDMKKRALGVFLKRDRDIWWFFPANGSDDCNRAISMNLDTLRFFPHELGLTVSAGCEWDFIPSVTWDSLSGYTWDNIAATYPTWDSFGSTSTPVDLVAQVSGKIHSFGVAATDNGTSVAARWRTGPLAAAGPGQRVRAESLDTYFELTNSAQAATTKVGSTDTLAADPTFPAELTDTLALGTDSAKVLDYGDVTAGIGTGLALARFVAVQHEVATTVDWRWGGAVFHYSAHKSKAQPES